MLTKHVNLDRDCNGDGEIDGDLYVDLDGDWDGEGVGELEKNEAEVKRKSILNTVSFPEQSGNKENRSPS